MVTLELGCRQHGKPSSDDLAGTELGGVSGLPALVRSSKKDSMVELLSRRMV